MRSQLPRGLKLLESGDVGTAFMRRITVCGGLTLQKPPASVRRFSSSVSFLMRVLSSLLLLLLLNKLGAPSSIIYSSNLSRLRLLRCLWRPDLVKNSSIILSIIGCIGCIDCMNCLVSASALGTLFADIIVQ